MKKNKQKADKRKLSTGGFTDYLKKNNAQAGQLAGIAGSVVGSVAGDTTGGAALSGALSGAGMGAALGPPGMAVGAVIGGGLGLIKSLEQKEQEKLALAQQKEAEQKAHAEWSKSVLKNYATNGVTGTNYYAKGGNISKGYEAEKDEVVQGYDTRLEAGSNLASDLMLVGGDTHEQGGTDGIGGERVYSDRLMSRQGKTFADVANKLGKTKGNLEKKFDTKNTASNNTASRMIPRIDEDLDNLFVEQEVSKASSFTKAARKMAWGGTIDPKNDKQVRAMQQQLLNSGYEIGTADGSWGPKSQAAYQQYSTMMNQLQPKIGIPNASPEALASYDPTKEIIPGIATQSQVTSVGAPVAKVAGFGDYANKVMTGVSAVAPFLDNVTNAMLRTPAIPKPVKQGQVRLNSNVDVNPELKAVDDAQRNFNNGVDRSTSSNAVGRANKASAFARTLDAKGNIYRTKRAEETAIKNQETAMNAQVNAQNNALENNFLLKNTMRADDINRRTSQNIAELSQNIQGISRDKKMDDMDIQRMKMTMQKNPEVFLTMLTNNPETLINWELSELEEQKTKYKGTAHAKMIEDIIAKKKIKS